MVYQELKIILSSDEETYDHLDSCMNLLVLITESVLALLFEALNGKKGRSIAWGHNRR